jgi:molybdopterin converting factor small subunit
MPVVHVPASLRAFSDGRERFDLEGATLGQVFAALARECPTLAERVVEDGMIREDIAVAIDGSILEGGEMVQQISPTAEIYLVPPIGGGSR